MFEYDYSMLIKMLFKHCFMFVDVNQIKDKTDRATLACFIIFLFFFSDCSSRAVSASVNFIPFWERKSTYFFILRISNCGITTCQLFQVYFFQIYYLLWSNLFYFYDSNLWYYKNYAFNFLMSIFIFCTT